MFPEVGLRGSGLKIVIGSMHLHGNRDQILSCDADMINCVNSSKVCTTLANSVSHDREGC